MEEKYEPCCRDGIECWSFNNGECKGKVYKEATESTPENVEKNAHLIGLAASTSTMLTNFIHGLAFGKTEELSNVDFENACNCFEQLKEQYRKA